MNILCLCKTKRLYIWVCFIDGQDYQQMNYDDRELLGSCEIGL